MAADLLSQLEAPASAAGSFNFTRDSEAVNLGLGLAVEQFIQVVFDDRSQDAHLGSAVAAVVDRRLRSEISQPVVGTCCRILCVIFISRASAGGVTNCRKRTRKRQQRTECWEGMWLDSAHNSELIMDHHVECHAA